MSDKIKYEQPPFKLDAKAPADLKDVEQDPAFQDSLQNKKTAVIHVDGETDIGDTKSRVSRDTHGPAARNLEKFAEESRYVALKDYEFRERVGPRFHKLRHHQRWEDDVADEFLVIPGDDFDHKKFLNKNVFDSLEGHNIENIPGTSQEWAALISYHELEHTASDRQNPLEDFYFEKEDEYDLNGFDYVLMKEVEADLGAYNALDEQLSDEVKEFWIAKRIASTVENNLSWTWAAREGEVNASHTHDTGFHLAEFHHTGEIPDYFAIQQAKAGFFENMRELRSDVDYDRDNLSEVMTAAMHLRDSGELSPEEEQIAQQLITSFEGQLGAKPDVELMKKFQNGPDHTQTPHSPAPETAPDPAGPSV